MRNFFTVFCVLISVIGTSQSTGIVAFYNVENLFDTVDDPHKQDNEFLPKSAKKWNSTRYQLKLQHIAEAISSIDNDNLPIFVGLCEVENRLVVNDLINQNPLKKGHYAVLHQNSPDKRGIDCAAIYRKDRISVEKVSFTQVLLPNHKEPSTRDILLAKVQLDHKYPLYILVNHWPSRLGGKEKSAVNRYAVAKKVRHLCDSLYQLSPNIPQIIIGDFNDTPSDSSLTFYLGADTLTNGKSRLQNLSYPIQKLGGGSYFYKNNWEMLDNVVVSKNLNKAGFLKVKRVAIHTEYNPLFYTNKQGTKSLARTYSGKQYHGGYSDHLPVFIELQMP